MGKVLYRKYRPLTFQDVVGQEHITRVLENEVRESRPAHAYLFTGTRGTGKTTCSKILARAVNCLNPQNGNPCNACDICLGLENGSIMDVMEIDAASNNRVEDVRILREETNYTPAVCKYRVYIIDEVHMLSINAFNALLKIMEEPPPHVIFILATTEVHKIPATILSRCQTFSFRRIGQKDICKRMCDIAKLEEFVLEEDAGMLIAKLAKGAMRDALSILNVCISQETVVTLDLVTKLIGLSEEIHLVHMVDKIIAYDCAKALQVLDEAYADSVEPVRFCQQLIEYLRELMLYLSVGKLDEYLPQRSETQKKQAEELGMMRVLEVLQMLQKALDGMSASSMRELQLEIAVVEFCTKSNHTAENPLQQKVLQLESDLSSVKEQCSRLSSGVILSQTTGATVSKSGENPAVPVGEAMKKNAHPLKQWQDIVKRLQTKNGALYGALRDSKAFLSDDVLLIQCESELFLSLIRENEYSRKTLREAAFEVTGQRYKLGPFKKELYNIEEKDDPLENFINKLDSSCEEIELK